MTDRVRFHPLASAEIVEAQQWYENRVAGLGDRFLRAVHVTTDRAARWPNAGSPTRLDAAGVAVERSVGVAGFPYIVVYRERADLIDILAVHHQRRRPLYWADRATE